MTMLRRLATVASTVGLAASLAACGDDNDVFAGDNNTGGSASGTGGSGKLTVGGANFTEMLIMQEMYKALLEDAGYTVTVQSVDAREIYEPALESGDIDIVPEYAATFAEFLNAKANGPNAPQKAPVASSDIADTMAGAQPLAEKYGLRLLEPAQAVDQNGFVVSKQFAEKNDLSTLSDLAALGKPIVLAAGEECSDRPFCQPGLESTYGLDITSILPLGVGSPQTKQAVSSGDAQLGLVGTTDGTLDGLGLVLLEDDKGLQLADNLAPVVNVDSAGDDAIADALAPLTDTLTTEDLATLNAQVDGERQQPDEVAVAYLKDKGLI
jgi:osmoprotectant transport system substrate-binding protein